MILVARVHADEMTAQAQEGHSVHQVGTKLSLRQIHNEVTKFIDRDRWDHMIVFNRRYKKVTVKSAN